MGYTLNCYALAGPQQSLTPLSHLNPSLLFLFSPYLWAGVAALAGAGIYLTYRTRNRSTGG